MKGKGQVAKGKSETLDLLHTAYDALTKAGRDSLSKAYAFGNVVNALHGIFTYAQLAAELGVTTSTVAKYAKLYRAYDSEQYLLHVATELGTYDVGVLAAGEAPARYVYAWHCQNCGSFNVKKERETDEVRALKEAEAARSVAGEEHAQDLLETAMADDGVTIDTGRPRR